MIDTDVNTNVPVLQNIFSLSDKIFLDFEDKVDEYFTSTEKELTQYINTVKKEVRK